MSKKINIVGTTAVVVSNVSMDDLKMLEKYSPKALVLTEKNDDGDTIELFKVGTGTGSSLNDRGAKFGGETNTTPKKATLTIDMGDKPESKDVKEYMSEKYGVAFDRLWKVEAQFEAALAKVKATQQAVADSIEVAL